MPKVSVIIPAYNAMTYLPETLESVLRQTFTNFEVLIIDDGSSDNIVEWASQLTDSRVKFISQNNQGSSAARNAGIINSSGDYIAFLDADDLWQPTKLEKQVHILEENPEAGLVYTWTALINHQGIPTGRIFANDAESYVWENLIKHNIVECGSVAMVRCCCFENVGVFDQNLHSYVEDWDMWLRIAARYPFKVIREPLVYYRQYPTSVSKTWGAMEQGFHQVIEKAFNSAPKELQYLKSQSYAFANLCLAWKPLQSLEKDLPMAIYYRQQAVMHYPQLVFSKEYLRLSLAIKLMQWFGADGYQNFLLLLHNFRRRTLGWLTLTQ
ncbi:glycosyl transferase [Cylindrospermum stagnale PCC 7417]|uniref:Glycosyl transferase n=1 Tax=Cylindrospermum stagnale PCC 7417 TaxID=56107 RepID=K9WQW1_9NOST|nr:glycosyltransferase family A protein [Cylindrospermum stagnale]AFZ22780.1 glycosyl transferase [Cylindrospermum stagnale PCC 7417]